jgi:outer membrane protein with beta-barrel domain
MKTSIVALSLLFTVCSTASAQTSPPRIEVGAQISALRLTDLDSTNEGFGGRVSYSFWPWLSVEGELNYFPSDTAIRDYEAIAPGFRLSYKRSRVEAFAGPKIGIRRNWFGVFAKARPGFEHLTDRGLNCAGEVCALALFMRPVYRTEFAVETGGVFEIYPSSRAVARFDVGTTIIRHRSDAVPPCRNCTTNNLTTKIGVGWRF